jgi:hypothetical protein
VVDRIGGKFMSEIGTSVGLRNRSRRRPRISEYLRWEELKGIRKILGLGFLAVVVVLGVECISSYVLYRHFAKLNRSFYPVGSATVDLARNVVAKVKGRRDEVDLSIDHGPLFRADEALGYTMYPGKYQITEKRYAQRHRFNLTVNDLGRRVVSDRPNTASKRLFIAGDSAMFGWGLNDDQTLPWLLQTRFPAYEVQNLSLTSYSTIQALQQLEHTSPKIGPDDIVVLTYHPITNGFNVVSAEMLGYLKSGFEHQLGDEALVNNMSVPFGSVGGQGELVIGLYPLACAQSRTAPAKCPQRPMSSREATQVTELAFDAILAAQPGHVVVAWLSGPDTDPVVRHLQSKGVTIADLRTDSSDPDAIDEVRIDEHAGPFWHRMVAERLGDALRRSGLIG